MTTNGGGGGGRDAANNQPHPRRGLPRATGRGGGSGSSGHDHSRRQQSYSAGPRVAIDGRGGPFEFRRQQQQQHQRQNGGRNIRINPQALGAFGGGQSINGPPIPPSFMTLAASAASRRNNNARPPILLPPVGDGEQPPPPHARDIHARHGAARPDSPHPDANNDDDDDDYSYNDDDTYDDADEGSLPELISGTEVMREAAERFAASLQASTNNPVPEGRSPIRPPTPPLRRSRENHHPTAAGPIGGGGGGGRRGDHDDDDEDDAPGLRRIMNRLFLQTVGVRAGLFPGAGGGMGMGMDDDNEPDMLDLFGLFDDAFMDVNPPTDVRKPDQLACPTCMRVHLPVEGSEAIDIPKEEEEEEAAPGGGSANNANENGNGNQREDEENDGDDEASNGNNDDDDESSHDSMPPLDSIPSANDDDDSNTSLDSLPQLVPAQRSGDNPNDASLNASQLTAPGDRSSFRPDSLNVGNYHASFNASNRTVRPAVPPEPVTSPEQSASNIFEGVATTGSSARVAGGDNDDGESEDEDLFGPGSAMERDLDVFAAAAAAINESIQRFVRQSEETDEEEDSDSDMPSLESIERADDGGEGRGAVQVEEDRRLVGGSEEDSDGEVPFTFEVEVEEVHGDSGESFVTAHTDSGDSSMPPLEDDTDHDSVPPVNNNNDNEVVVVEDVVEDTDDDSMPPLEGRSQEGEDESEMSDVSNGLSDLALGNSRPQIPCRTQEVEQDSDSDDSGPPPLEGGYHGNILQRTEEAEAEQASDSDDDSGPPPLEGGYHGNIDEVISVASSADASSNDSSMPPLEDVPVESNTGASAGDEVQRAAPQAQPSGDARSQSSGSHGSMPALVPPGAASSDEDSSLPALVPREDASSSSSLSMPPLIRRDPSSSDSDGDSGPSIPSLIRSRAHHRVASTMRRFLMSRNGRDRNSPEGGQTSRNRRNERDRTATNPLTHLRNYGALRVYAKATCPICLEEHEPIVALQCGHAICEDDYRRLGGYLATDKEKLKKLAVAAGDDAAANSGSPNAVPPVGPSQPNRQSTDSDRPQGSRSIPTSVTVERGAVIDNSSPRRTRRAVAQQGSGWAFGFSTNPVQCPNPNCQLRGVAHRILFSISDTDSNGDTNDNNGLKVESCYPIGTKIIPDGHGGLWIHEACRSTIWPVLHRNRRHEVKKFDIERAADLESDGAGGVWAMTQSDMGINTSLSEIKRYSSGNDGNQVTHVAAKVPHGSEIWYDGKNGKIWVYVDSYSRHALSPAERTGVLDEGLWLLGSQEKVKFGEASDGVGFATGDVDPDGNGNLWFLEDNLETGKLVLKRCMHNGDRESTYLEFDIGGTEVYGCNSSTGVFVFHKSDCEDDEGELTYVSRDDESSTSQWTKTKVGVCPKDTKFASDGAGGLWALMVDLEGETMLWKCNGNRMEPMHEWMLTFASAELVGG